MAQVGGPEGPRGRFWKDFRPFLGFCWDDFSKVFGRISMLGLLVFKMFASSFWGRWWEISLCCCHPLEYDLVLDCTLFVMFFTCSSMLGFRILECFEVIAFMSGVMAKSHGLVRCDWSGLLTCGLVSFVRFGSPGMVSYGLDRLF